MRVFRPPGRPDAKYSDATVAGGRGGGSGAGGWGAAGGLGALGLGALGLASSLRILATAQPSTASPATATAPVTGHALEGPRGLVVAGRRPAQRPQGGRRHAWRGCRRGRGAGHLRRGRPGVLGGDGRDAAIPPAPTPSAATTREQKGHPTHGGGCQGPPTPRQGSRRVAGRRSPTPCPRRDPRSQAAAASPSPARGRPTTTSAARRRATRARTAGSASRPARRRGRRAPTSPRTARRPRRAGGRGPRRSPRPTPASAIASAAVERRHASPC